MTTAEDALKQGLEVWFMPVMVYKSPQETLAYITRAAAEAEELRQQWPERLVFVVGGEASRSGR
jgi:hypothetical protein